MSTLSITVLDSIYKSVWMLLVKIVAICDAIQMAFINMYLFYKYYDVDNYIRSKDIQFLEGCKADMAKSPKHLSVIVGSEELCPDVLSKIVVYSLISDINYITVYDSRGGFSLDDIKIPQFVTSHKLNEGKFIWSLPNNKRNSGLLKYRNGLERSIEVRYLSYKEGKPLLADICKDLFNKTSETEMKNSIKDKSNVAELVKVSLKKKLDNLPEVEVAIIIGKNMCTFGLLPWHTGFTEFNAIEDDGKYFNVQTFVDILYKYSKCEQRFGK